MDFLAASRECVTSVASHSQGGLLWFYARSAAEGSNGSFSIPSAVAAASRRCLYIPSAVAACHASPDAGLRCQAGSRNLQASTQASRSLQSQGQPHAARWYTRCTGYFDLFLLFGFQLQQQNQHFLHLSFSRQGFKIKKEGTV